MSLPDLIAKLTSCTERQSLAGLRVVVEKPGTKGWVRNIYQDLDQETPSSERLVLVQFFPQFMKDEAAGIESTAQEVISHPRAIKDIWNQIKRYGWTLTFIGKDR